MTGRPSVRIAQQRIGRLHTHLLTVPRDAVLTPALTDTAAHAERLVEIGFPAVLEAGQTLLPAVVGPRSRFNADGGERVHRDRPKETVSRLAWARWLERHGGDQREIRGVRPWTYERFPRTRVPAPHLDLRVCADARGRLVVAARPLARRRDDTMLLHAVNLFLELFGECVLVEEALRPLTRAPERRLNWDVGRPVESLTPVVGDLPVNERRVAEYRIDRVRELEPDFTAVGRAGFRGCAVFGFAGRGRMVVESLYGDSPTYVTERPWSDLASLSKDELLAETERAERIDHTRGWERRLREAVSGG